MRRQLVVVGLLMMLPVGAYCDGDEQIVNYMFAEADQPEVVVETPVLTRDETELDEEVAQPRSARASPGYHGQSQGSARPCSRSPGTSGSQARGSDRGGRQKDHQDL